MEGELGKLIAVWTTILACHSYSYAAGRIIPTGTLRLLTLLPVLFLFLLLPFSFSSLHLRGITAFFLSWLSNFKLLLFAFGAGPLASSPPSSLPHFLALASLPIQIKPPSSTPTTPPKASKIPPWLLNKSLKTLLLALLLRSYSYNEILHPYILLGVYSLHIYISLEMVMDLVALLARVLLGAQLEPQFDEPYLSTSLQDFWSRRWNLMVSNILRPTVYVPVLRLSSPIVGRRWAPIPAVFFTFVVSALMHELMYFYLGRVRPTWEVTGFFVLHGACLAVELAGKKMLLRSSFYIPGVVSAPLTICFVGATAFWLFFPQLLRCDAMMKGVEEVTEFGDFVKKAAYWSFNLQMLNPGGVGVVVK